jgi:Zn-dependent peptidase ImmA (M78 family)
MAVRVNVPAAMLRWAQETSSLGSDELTARFPKWADWVSGSIGPTLNQLEQLANVTGIPFGYLLLLEPPTLNLPVADFREGFDEETRGKPSTSLLAVINQSLRRQAWYREYAIENELPRIQVVGGGRDAPPDAVAASIRELVEFEVDQRAGNRSDTRKALLRGFEALGGLTVATSMVANNTHRPLDPDEFRGFTLADEYAPLVFVNTGQTLNGQIFTIVHEFAHVWDGRGGISDEDAGRLPKSSIERWCNAVASEVLVPRADLQARYPETAGLGLTAQLERLAAAYRCGTLVVLQALRRDKLRKFIDFSTDYNAEVERLSKIGGDRGSGGDHYRNQPFRVGDRLSRALITDTLEGGTPLAEALELMSMKSLSNFDEYARRLGVG